MPPKRVRRPTDTSMPMEVDAPMTAPAKKGGYSRAAKIAAGAAGAVGVAGVGLLLRSLFKSNFFGNATEPLDFLSEAVIVPPGMARNVADAAMDAAAMAVPMAATVASVIQNRIIQPVQARVDVLDNTVAQLTANDAYLNQGVAAIADEAGQRLMYLEQAAQDTQMLNGQLMQQLDQVNAAAGQALLQAQNVQELLQGANQNIITQTGAFMPMAMQQDMPLLDSVGGAQAAAQPMLWEFARGAIRRGRKVLGKLPYSGHKSKRIPASAPLATYFDPPVPAIVEMDMSVDSVRRGMKRAFEVDSGTAIPNAKRLLTENLLGASNQF